MTTQIRAIVAVSPEGVIGVNNGIPWHKKQDLKRFKAQTMGGTLIMGRKTWESIGCRKLPGRETLVLSRTPQANVDTYASLKLALSKAKKLGNPIWVAGGAEVYKAAEEFVDSVDLTLVTDYRLPPNPIGLVRYDLFLQGMPGFWMKSEEENLDDKSLIHRLYRKV